jgi:lysophospholipase L1-like esterase
VAGIVALSVTGLVLHPEFAFAKRRIFIIGDSTAATYRSRDASIAGWGEMLAYYLPPGFAVENRSVPGRSARTFHASDWPKVLDSVRSGDIVIVQFGHNDLSSDPSRGTAPYGSYSEFLVRYIHDIRERMATCVLVTPVSMRLFHEGKPLSALAAYQDAMRRVSASEGVLLIDVAAETQGMLRALGENGSRILYAHTGADGANTSVAHLSPEGARRVARYVAEVLAGQLGPLIAAP